MFENIDLSWFLTTPGMLTCLGCLLIIISIIIFISSLRGNKKDKLGNTNGEVGGQIPEVQEGNQVQDANVGLGIDPTIKQTVENTVSNTQDVVQPVEVPPINVTNTQPPVEPINVAPPTPIEPTPISVSGQPIDVAPVQPEPIPVTPVAPTEINVAPVSPVEPAPISVTETPVQQPINITPIQSEPTPVTPVAPTEINIAPASSVEPAPISVTETPVQQPINIAPIQPESTPVTQATPTEINTPPVTVQPENQTLNNFTGINIEPVIQPVPPVNNMTESNPVNLPYGGANPAATITPLQEENKVIYGGADPLAGTGVIPQVSNDQVTELKKPEDIESL